MVTEESCNTLVITNLFRQQHPEIVKQIEDTCLNHSIDLITIDGANDLWCRDFMPVQVQPDRFVQFDFDPSYYRHPKYEHLKTDVRNVHLKLHGQIVKSDIILDGGNVCYSKKKVIITDKIFKDNPSKNKSDLVEQLYTLFDAEIIIIPAVPYDITGHADGIVRFIDEETIFLNDFRHGCSESYCNKLFKSLQDLNIVLLPNDFHLNKITDDATGDYLNMVVIRDIVFIPKYNTATDDFAYNIVKDVFPKHTIVPIECNALAVKGGVLHCSTWSF